jgi:hypothetical protein
MGAGSDGHALGSAVAAESTAAATGSDLTSAAASGGATAGIDAVVSGAAGVMV